MRFLKENNQFEIQINKYNKNDLGLANNGIWFIGRDLNASKFRREPEKPQKVFIHKSQIAEFENYLYIPEDKIPKDTNIYTFTKPEDVKILKKYQWLALKTKYPYKGE